MSGIGDGAGSGTGGAGSGAGGAESDVTDGCDNAEFALESCCSWFLTFSLSFR